MQSTIMSQNNRLLGRPRDVLRRFLFHCCNLLLEKPAAVSSLIGGSRICVFAAAARGALPACIITVVGAGAWYHPPVGCASWVGSNRSVINLRFGFFPREPNEPRAQRRNEIWQQTIPTQNSKRNQKHQLTVNYSPCFENYTSPQTFHHIDRDEQHKCFDV